MTMPEKNKRTGVIGVGNVFMGDDSVGVEVLELLKNESLPENVILINNETRGMSLLHTLAKLDAAVIVDAVDFGGSPGEACCFTPKDVKSEKQVRGLSTHECDLLNVIELSNKLGELPETIIIFGIQPETMTYPGDLSPLLKKKLPGLVNDILGIIHHIACGNDK